ncbi:MAG TPA: peptidylglycine alpha-amidating monooxygenase [Polyangiaceae bacterium]
MRKAALPFLLATTTASALVILSCGGNSLTGGSTNGVTVQPGATPLPCDVNDVLQAHCQSCHQNPPLNGAPMPLITWQDLQAPSHSDPKTPVYKQVEARIHDDAKPMPQPPNPRLGAADLATLDGWVNAGAPAGSAACIADASVPDSAPPASNCSSNNAQVAPSQPWAMPTTDDDDYVCYGVTLPTTGTGESHVIGITPNIVNTKIVHHVLLFQANTPMSSVPAKCSAAGSLQWRIVYGWAPGGGAMQAPEGVGFPYDSTTAWVVQVHYNNVNHLANEVDTSGFSFCTTDQPVQYDADVLAFGTQSINIQPNQTLDKTCNYTVDESLDGAHFFAAFPHMHQLGAGIETVQEQVGGGVVGLGKNDPWNFNNQLWFPITTQVHQGDVISTRCVWNNNTSSTVTFGQNTENEMCYSFTAYYPRLSSSLSWALPAIKASCTTNNPPPTPDAGWSQ